MEHQFTDIIRLPYTKIKNQGSTSSCWAFSILSWLETENWLLKGKEEVNLSPWYILYHKTLDQFEVCANHKGRPIVLPNGGLGHTAMMTIAHHGVVREEDYNVKTPGRKIGIWTFRFAKGFTLLSQYVRFLRPLCRFGVKLSLWTLMGKAPKYVTNDTKRISPVEFCKSNKINPDDYVQYTSFNFAPYETDIILDVPDNAEKAKYHNIPLDQLIDIMKQTLLSGHTFVWDGGIRNGVFYSKQHGYAKVRKSFDPVTEDIRSQEFLAKRTTDDHMLHIVGLAKDENDALVFIAKDSAPSRGKYDGIIYLYEDFVRLKTISIVVTSKSTN